MDKDQTWVETLPHIAFKRCGCASFGLSAHGEMEPMKMISKELVWLARQERQRSLSYYYHSSVFENRICERLNVFTFLCVCKIPFRFWRI